MNLFGRIFRVTIFGESHNDCVGITVDGCPAGLSLSVEDLLLNVENKQEADYPSFKSGLFNGKTTGFPITILFENSSATLITGIVAAGKIAKKIIPGIHVNINNSVDEITEYDVTEYDVNGIPIGLNRLLDSIKPILSYILFMLPSVKGVGFRINDNHELAIKITAESTLAPEIVEAVIAIVLTDLMLIEQQLPKIID